MNQPEIGSASLQAVQEALQELVEERLALTTVLGYFAEINTRNKPRRRLNQGMKELRRTLAIVLLVGPLISLYTTFVLKNLWNWFATEALHLPEISFWVMFGLVLIIGMFTSNFGHIEQEYGFKSIGTALDACVPEDKRDWVREQLEDQQKAIWGDIGMKLFSRIFGATCTLVIGWAVHAFLL